MFEEQQASVTENTIGETADDFLEGFCGEEQPEEREASAPLAQEESTEEKPLEEKANSEEESTEESATNAEGEKPAEEPEKAEDACIEITFLGEKKQITLDEAKDLAEKGMNLDRMRQRVTRLESELKANAVPPEVEAYAKTCGMTGQALIAHFGQLARNAGIEVAASDGYMHQKAVDDWKDFMREYPDVNPKTDLPQEVWNGINAGLTPRQALIEFKARGFEAQLAAKDKEIADAVAEKDKKIAELEKALETERKNNKNAQKAVGSLATSGNGTDDDFLNAFLNA